MDQFSFVDPRIVNDANDCYFYHKFDLPNVGEVGDSWDLRPCIDDYLGRCEFNNKRVLDVGTASGFLTFEMERRGADVVSFDMPSAEHWNLVPHHQIADELTEKRDAFQKVHNRLQNAYWFSHQQLQSNAKAYYGDIYNLPAQLGNFDVVMLGMITCHLRDPFQAIYSAGRLSSDLIVITSQVSKLSWWKRLRGKKQQVSFVPSATDAVHDSWWFLPPRCIERMLGTIGFEVIRQIESFPTCVEKSRTGSERCVSIVARRFAGTPAGIDSDSQYQVPRAA